MGREQEPHWCAPLSVHEHWWEKLAGEYRSFSEGCTCQCFNSPSIELPFLLQSTYPCWSSASGWEGRLGLCLAYKRGDSITRRPTLLGGGEGYDIRLLISHIMTSVLSHLQPAL